MGCGRAIVSTPYDYALDILSNNRGLISENTNSPGELADLIGSILDNPTLKRGLESRAAKRGKTMTWTNVAKQYINLMGVLIQGNMRGSKFGSLVQTP